MKINVNTALILLGILILGFLIWTRLQPPSGTEVVYRDTSRTPAVVITMPAPTIQVPGQTLPQVNVTGLDSAALRSMLVDLLEQHRKLFADHSAYRQYDTVLADSNAVESLSVAVQNNRLQRLYRKLDVINTTRVVESPDPWLYLGGWVLANREGIPEYGPSISYRSSRGAVYTVNRSLNSKTWIGGVQFPILKKKWRPSARDRVDK